VTALELQHLAFGYGRAATIRDVSLTLAPGDCYGFLGHNGAGKSTVLRLAMGLLQPSGGSIRVFGTDARREPRRARAVIGALVERPGFWPHVTALQNLRWLAQLQGMRRSLAIAEAARVLDLLGLAAARSRAVGTFSQGMQQRLGIAAALLGRPPILLLDEPTNGLDPEGIADLRALLRRLTADEGTAVLLSSHMLQELEGLCTRVGVLREGAMVVEGDLDSLRAKIGARHVVTGSPLPAMARRLRDLGLAPASEGNRLLVALGDRPASTVARELVAVGELASFAPEPATLEAIYLRATNGSPFEPPPPREHTPSAPLPAAPRAPRRRAFAHEMRTLLGSRSMLPLVLVPAAVAAWSAFSYERSVGQSRARRPAGGQLSPHAGRG
jgi:ABC-2 type transport system ATP-binding protein